LIIVVALTVSLVVVLTDFPLNSRTR